MPDIELKNRSSEKKIYKGVERVSLPKANGGRQTFIIADYLSNLYTYIMQSKDNKFICVEDAGMIAGANGMYGIFTRKDFEEYHTKNSANSELDQFVIAIVRNELTIGQEYSAIDLMR